MFTELVGDYTSIPGVLNIWRTRSSRTS